MGVAVVVVIVVAVGAIVVVVGVVVIVVLTEIVGSVGFAVSSMPWPVTQYRALQDAVYLQFSTCCMV